MHVACQGHRQPQKNIPSLAIDFCGIHCENPFFLASSAACTNYEMVARAFDMGWGGVFYKTICMQKIVLIEAIIAQKVWPIQRKHYLCTDRIRHASR